MTRIIGLMSGTSLDGVDAVAMEFSADGSMKRLGHQFHPYDPRLRARLLQLAQASISHNEIERLLRCAVPLGQAYSDVVLALIKKLGMTPQDFRALAIHGQTLRHRPQLHYSLQWNHPAWVAEKTGIDVICDFRARDLAAGGEGAPLVPAFHQAIFGHVTQSVIANIGGIANISILQRPSPFGFDTGPGNMLIDWICQHFFACAFDQDGALARQGQVRWDLLEKMRQDPYFAQRPPKSTGREYFHAQWLQPWIDQASPKDLLCTLTELTASTLTDAIHRYAPKSQHLWLCGGGALNTYLCRRIQNYYKGSVQSTAVLGIHPMEVEASAFAWLGYQFLQRKPGNLPAVTNAQGFRILGALYPH